MIHKNDCRHFPLRALIAASDQKRAYIIAVTLCGLISKTAISLRLIEPRVAEGCSSIRRGAAAQLF